MAVTYRRRELWLLLGLAASLLLGLGVERAVRSHPEWVERVETLEEPVRPETKPAPPAAAAPILRLPTRRTPLDLNRASAVELERLPGVGPVLAQKIIQYREQRGRFTDPAELRQVGGIGPKKYDAMRELVTAQ
jgi:competence ComEA-like helix-hairpin-helix protein